MGHFNIHLNLKFVVACMNRKQLEWSLWNASRCEIWFQQFSMLLLVAMNLANPS